MQNAPERSGAFLFLAGGLGFQHRRRRGPGLRRGRTLEFQAAALEEGPGFHRQLLVGDVAVDIGGAVEADLLGGDRADDPTRTSTASA